MSRCLCLSHIPVYNEFSADLNCKIENMLSCDSVAESAIMGSKRKTNKAVHFLHLAGKKQKLLFL